MNNININNNYYLNNKKHNNNINYINNNMRNIDNNEINNNLGNDIQNKEIHSKDDFSNDLRHSLKPKKEIKDAMKGGKMSLYKSIGPFDKSKNYKKLNKKKSAEEIKKKKEKEEMSKAQIKDVLNCYICQSKLINPRMCRTCKKLACEKCLEKWLKENNICAFCRTKTKFEDTVRINIIDDMIQFFTNEIEKDSTARLTHMSNKSADNEEVADEDTKYIENEDISNEDICNEHNKINEYFCVQCNKKLCAGCLSILNKSAAIHEHHIIFSSKEDNNEEIRKLIDEFKKLKQTKEKVEDLIGLCNLKKKILEIEKIQKERNLEIIKKALDDNLLEKLKNFKVNQNSLKSKIEDINRAVETTPIALKNLVNSNDHRQASKIYEHLMNVNQFNENKYNLSNELNGLFIESFSSEELELTVPNNGNYTEDLELYNKELNNFINDNKVKINLRYHKKNICFVVEIENILRKADKNTKYYGFLIIQTKKHDCEFLIVDELSDNYKYILTTQFPSDHFILYKDENNIIRFKLNLMKNIIK